MTNQTLVYWLLNAKTTDIVTVGILFCVILILLTVSIVVILQFLFKVFKKITIKKGDSTIEFDKDGKEKEETEESLVTHLEVRDYRNCIINAFDLFREDIFLRIEQNGWEEISDWKEYKRDAMVQHDLIITHFLDEHYYTSAKIKREELFEWNKLISSEINSVYDDMYDKLLTLVRKEHKDINNKKKLLETMQKDYKLADINISDIIKLTTEIVLEENVLFKNKCKADINRAISNIIQILYSHYLKKFKEVKNQ